MIRFDRSGSMALSVNEMQDAEKRERRKEKKQCEEERRRRKKEICNESCVSLCVSKPFILGVLVWRSGEEEREDVVKRRREEERKERKRGHL